MKIFKKIYNWIKSPKQIDIILTLEDFDEDFELQYSDGYDCPIYRALDRLNYPVSLVQSRMVSMWTSSYNIKNNGGGFYNILDIYTNLKKGHTCVTPIILIKR